MFDFVNLSEDTRQLMIAEMELDVSRNDVYLSPRLTDMGRRDFVALFIEACRLHDEEWLGQQLNMRGRLKTTEPWTRQGVTRERAVRHDAHMVLAGGEFNMFYCRAVCAVVIAIDPLGMVEVYRAKAVVEPRLLSQLRIGQHVKAKDLLADLRQHKGVDTALGVPGGPCSGISVKMLAS